MRTSAVASPETGAPAPRCGAPSAALPSSTVSTYCLRRVPCIRSVLAATHHAPVYEIGSEMLAYVIRRLWQFVPTLLGVMLLVFLLFNWIGGDPAYILAGKISNPEQLETTPRQLGVAQPYWVQLWIFVKQIVTGDFGESW